MQKPKSFRPWQPEQTTLLPPSPREWLADDHQVYFLLDLVDELDLSAILGPAEAKDPRGHKGFDPRMLTMPKRGPLPRDADAKTRMARKLRSKKGSKIYAQRKTIVEPVNGQIKEARGLRRFLLRGLEKVDGEWHLIAATHNLLKLFRYRRSEQQGLEGAIG
jgi:hypothetical protein